MWKIAIVSVVLFFSSILIEAMPTSEFAEFPKWVLERRANCTRDCSRLGVAPNFNETTFVCTCPIYKFENGSFVHLGTGEVITGASLVSVEDEDDRTKCNKTCAKMGAKAHFDDKLLNCKCIVVIDWNAKKLAPILKRSTQSVNFFQSTKRLRRHLPENHYNQINYRASEEMGPIVGQAIAPLHRPARINTPPNRILINQNANLEKARKRMREQLVARNAAARAAGRNINSQAQAEVIKGHWKRINERLANLQTPEQRAQRARLIAERRARERQRLHRIRSGTGMLGIRGGRIPVVGAAPKTETTTMPPQENRSKNGRPSHNNGHNSIIVQPEEFIED